MIAMADEARARADAYREATGMLTDAATRPLAAWQALKDAVTGSGTEAETALTDAATSADTLAAGLDGLARQLDELVNGPRDFAVWATRPEHEPG